MDAFALAKKYYPKYWNIGRLIYLVSIGRLTEEEFEAITGISYAAAIA